MLCFIHAVLSTCLLVEDRDASTAPPTSAATSASSDLPNGELTLEPCKTANTVWKSLYDSAPACWPTLSLHKTYSAWLAHFRVLILGNLQNHFHPAQMFRTFPMFHHMWLSVACSHCCQHNGMCAGIADMLEQWEAKAEQAGTLADKKEYVAAAKIAAECVALAETCGASVSQRTTLVEFHESLEQMATFQREVAPRIRHKMRSIQSGSHDAGNVVSLLKLARLNHGMRYLEVCTDRSCWRRQAQPREQRGHATA